MFHTQSIRGPLLAAAFATLGMAAQGALAADPFTLTSSAFKDGTMLAVKNAGNIKTNPNCIGENVSPPLSWANPPAGTKSYALMMTDPEGRAGLGVVHWLAYGIPASVTSFAENEVSGPSPKYIGGKGTAGMSAYLGPCTPPGTGMHHYTFIMVATDLEPSEFQPGMTQPELIAKLTGHSKGSAGLVGLFGRP